MVLITSLDYICVQWQSKNTQMKDQSLSQTSPTTPRRMPLGRNLNAQDFPPIIEAPTTEEFLEEIQGATLRYVNVEDPNESAARRLRVLQSEMDGTVEETVGRITQGTATDINTPPPIPTAEQVLDDIQKATLQYTNVADPIERAARMQRVLQSEIDGSVEETVAGIIQASSEAHNLHSITSVPVPQITTTATRSSTQGQPSRRRGRPARSQDIRISPKVFKGSSSWKHY
ncbi:unnamed protein product [Eruca vesicaria subsp. sativa]|uniref:Uncharacterized protein n=1 Tax=Eruca vesicaria subsp. sativa TaxID=29727 RepID=A0ABC8LEH9_ERUVS|nr:unnamed protein product [Eruca vesicaria subsp. sativa]